MGNSESRHLVESPQALADEVKEAAQVLESAVEGDDEHSSGDDEQSSSSSHTNPGDEAQKKNLLGARLYPLIQQSHPDLAGKITGMLLELDNSEVMHMIECPRLLGAKIEEALQVLEAHGMLLEMGNSEARHLVESPEALADKVKEAVQVLESVVEGDDEQSSSSSHTNPCDEFKRRIS